MCGRLGADRVEVPERFPPPEHGYEPRGTIHSPLEFETLSEDRFLYTRNPTSLHGHIGCMLDALRRISIPV
jgi:hypothetical protein